MENKIIKESFEPTLFLFDNADFIIRPIGKPYMFFGYFKNGEFVLNNSNNKYFLLPGIKKHTNEIGFLFLTENNFSKIISVLKYRKIDLKKSINRNLIFYYLQNVEGLFKVFIDPEEKIEENIIEKVNLICNNPEEFIYKIFRKEENCESIYNATITKNMLKVFKEVPKIS